MSADAQRLPTRRALVSQTRPPEVDRDSGSQQVDLYIRWLLEAGWSVTFMSSDTDGEPYHAHRLRQMGIPVFIGYDQAEDVIATGDFDLAVLAFWEPASRLLPVLRRVSPDTRVVVDSVDLHFLRDARRTLGSGVALDESYGTRLMGELSTYASADGVLAVSAKEADLLTNLLGPDRIYELPVAKTVSRSDVGFDERRGMFFVGNFRHLPNGEAVEYMCREILPRLDPELRAAHPLAVVGSRLGDQVRQHGQGLPEVEMVGWVPSIRPYLEHSRICVVPLLHGAGVKGKIIESLLAGTPVATTPVGAEGLGLRDGEHAVIAETAAEFAEGLTRLLTDDEQWGRMAEAGHELAHARHSPPHVGRRFVEIAEEVLGLPTRPAPSAGEMTPAGQREHAYRSLVSAVTDTLAGTIEAGAKVAVVSRGDDSLRRIEGCTAWHFPRAKDGRWAGHHPANSQMAIRHLEEQREAGVRYFVLPGTAFWWLNHYRDFFAHLDGHYHRVRSNQHAIVFELGESAQTHPDPGEDLDKVLVVGSHEPAADGPPPDLRDELSAATRFDVAQRWAPSPGGVPAGEGQVAENVEWVLYVGDGAKLPEGFVDSFLGAARSLARLGVERLQPAHDSGPEAGPPATERVLGVHARELESVTPIPVLAVRRGARTEGPTTIVDSIPIQLRRPVRQGPSDPPVGDVGDVFVGDAESPRRAVYRGQWAPRPRISVLIATYDRSELLTACLTGFCAQTLPPGDFEVVVVDDGTPGPKTEAVLREFSEKLPLTWARIEHAGRAAAKNLALMLARGDLLVFFDDDDVPAADMLDAHLRAHERHPDEHTAILGHTDWSPELRITSLMHYVTDVDAMLFAYGHLEPGKRLDWRCFWEGRVSSKRALHLRHALHDQRLAYSIDVEMAWRLAPHGLEVFYEPEARSTMLRSVGFEDFRRRCEAKGRAQAAIASLHDDAELRQYLRVDGAAERWHEAAGELDSLSGRIRELEEELGDDASELEQDKVDELHRAYRAVFQAEIAKGIAEGMAGVGEGPADPAPDEAARVAVAATNGDLADGRAQAESENGQGPLLTVTMPVWSRTPELAAMAVRAIERVWEVSRMPLEVVVVDNGSPEPHPGLRARVFRFDENQGVASGWNQGIELARTPVIAVLNSDCWVEPGWDEGLYEAVTTGRRIAFPYTDHCDGRGFRQPDQAGTAGWCFMLTREVFDEVGPFDERFNPAYVEDTDYWHRAWELGIELAPVPAARVTHARRTSADKRSAWLLTAHRYMYGWKHGVEPMGPPPYYKREITEYHCEPAGDPGA
jgi:GT2 family glycosyltransferase/glycosyltransferase involved in cell wall biosynthesis